MSRICVWMMSACRACRNPASPPSPYLALVHWLRPASRAGCADQPHNLLLPPRKRNPSSAAGIARSRLLCFKSPAGRLKAAGARGSCSKGSGRTKAKGAFVSESALHILMAVSRILSPAPVFLASSNQLDCFSEKLGLDDDHLSHPAPVLLARCQDRHLRSRNWGWTSGEFSFAVMRRYPRINSERFRGVRTGCPPSVLSCTAWGFSCLANYSASGELLPRHFTLACS